MPCSASRKNIAFAMLLLLYLGWTHFGLAANDNALYTFSFLTLLYFAAFSIVSARERRWFGATMPGKTLTGALVADVITGTVLTVCRSSGTPAAARVADARNFHLCNVLLSGRE